MATHAARIDALETSQRTIVALLENMSRTLDVLTHAATLGSVHIDGTSPKARAETPARVPTETPATRRARAAGGRCPTCDKPFAYASGLKYHTDRTHKA